MPVSEDAYKIFLSYPSSRLAQVVRLSKFLESKGFKTWYAPRDIPLGAIWDDEITDALETCDALVLVFCKKAEESEIIHSEVRIAGENGKPRFYLRVEEGVSPKRLNLLIGSFQWRDWFDENNEAPLNEIASVIHKKLNDSMKSEHNPEKQSSTGNIFLSDSLAKRAQKFIASMSTDSALAQIRGGNFQQIITAGTQNFSAVHQTPLIFLSYPNEKAESAKIIADFLESRGFKTWYAQRDIQAGAMLYEEISAAIERCDAFVCVLSSESEKSEDCIDELVFAVDQSKPIFTVRTENFVSKKRLSLYLGAQYIDWFSAKDIEPLERLADVLSQKL